MFIQNLSIRTPLVWIFAFLIILFSLSHANSETKLEASRYYADGIELSKARYWQEATDEFRKAIKVDPKHNREENFNE